tara:strand:- start:291 stop:1091 length:801 start_codon:yes stop_codon:yes gene_type:complete
MNKQLINMVGGGFQHDVCSSAGSVPKQMEWVKDGSATISIHVDSGINGIKTDKSKENYAWLSESKTINTGLHNWSINNVSFLEENFEMIFTHDESLLPLSDKFKMVICNAKPWVTDFGIHEKNKMLSMVASSKVMCPAHVIRQDTIKKFTGQMDHFGRGFKVIGTKDNAIKDYYFSIAMENGDYPVMYTEKISDCFAMGTIPIYYGSNRINEIFDENGIIMLTDNFKVEDLSEDLYHSKIESVKHNFEVAINLPTAEDYIYNNFIK